MTNIIVYFITNILSIQWFKNILQFRKFSKIPELMIEFPNKNSKIFPFQNKQETERFRSIYQRNNSLSYQLKVTFTVQHLTNALNRNIPVIYRSPIPQQNDSTIVANNGSISPRTASRWKDLASRYTRNGKQIHIAEYSRFKLSREGSG